MTLLFLNISSICFQVFTFVYICLHLFLLVFTCFNIGSYVVLSIIDSLSNSIKCWNLKKKTCHVYHIIILKFWSMTKTSIHSVIEIFFDSIVFLNFKAMMPFVLISVLVESSLSNSGKLFFNIFVC